MQKEEHFTKIKPDKYSLSFTSGSLLYHESLILARLHAKFKSWKAVREQVNKKNLLKTRTLNSSKQICQQVISRLKTLHQEELDLLIEGHYHEQLCILWLAICRRYRFIADFALEVLHERYISFNPSLSYQDFDSFFSQKYQWHPELAKIRPTTIKKARQIIFRMLRQAELLNQSNKINGTLFGSKFLGTIPKTNRRDFLYFPVFGNDLQRMLS